MWLHSSKVSFALIACVGFWGVVLVSDIGSAALIASAVGVAALTLWSAGFPDDAGFGTDTAMLALLAVLSAHAINAGDVTSAILLGVTVISSAICVRRWGRNHCRSRALLRLITGVGITGAAVSLADATSEIYSALIAALVWVPTVLLTVGFVARSPFVGRVTGKAQGSRPGPVHLSAH